MNKSIIWKEWDSLGAECKEAFQKEDFLHCLINFFEFADNGVHFRLKSKLFFHSHFIEPCHLLGESPAAQIFSSLILEISLLIDHAPVIFTSSIIISKFLRHSVNSVHGWSFADHFGRCKHIHITIFSAVEFTSAFGFSYLHLWGWISEKFWVPVDPRRSVSIPDCHCGLQSQKIYTFQRLSLLPFGLVLYQTIASSSFTSTRILESQISYS